MRTAFSFLHFEIGFTSGTRSRNLGTMNPPLSPESLYEVLERIGVHYERHDHPPVYTCEEADRLVPESQGAKTKNLFLTDRKGRRYFLVVVGDQMSVDVKALSPMVGANGLRLASPRRLREVLGLEPGSVTILALINDPRTVVDVVFETSIWTAAAVRCHPLVNTSTLTISHRDIERFLEYTGHRHLVVDVPAR